MFKKATLENPIEQYVVNKALDTLGVKSVKLQLHNDTGYPDRMFLIPGGTPLFHEYKKPKSILRLKQSTIHEMLIKLGYEVETHDEKIKAFWSVVKAVERARQRNA